MYIHIHTYANFKKKIIVLLTYCKTILKFADFFIAWSIFLALMTLLRLLDWLEEDFSEKYIHLYIL